MPRNKYLTEERFQKFLENDWRHLYREVWQIKGMLAVLIPLVLAVLGGLLKLLGAW